jgi:hypothetical protein
VIIKEAEKILIIIQKCDYERSWEDFDNNNNNNNNTKMIMKEAEKILKFKDLTIEIQRMWNVKTKVITGSIS